jgi:two-component system, NarL family, nitrate/nitrite response regulator NarL
VASHSAATAPRQRGYAAHVPRTLIVDDSEPFLKSAQRLLGVGGVRIVGTARTRQEAVRLAEELRPDIVLVDIDLGGENGLDVARDLAALEQPPVVVLISTHTEVEVGEMVAAAPVAGFIPKSRLDAAAVRAFLR